MGWSFVDSMTMGSLPLHRECDEQRIHRRKADDTFVNLMTKVPVNSVEAVVTVWISKPGKFNSRAVTHQAFPNGA